MVPSHAGLIYSSSLFGSLTEKGEATCKTYSQPLTASSQPSSPRRSSLTNSNLLLGSISFFIPSNTSFLLLR